MERGIDEYEGGAGGALHRDGLPRPGSVDPTTDHDPVQPGAGDAVEDERHRRVMASAERIMRKHRNAFAALAK